MPRFTVREVREVHILADNIELAGYVGRGVLHGEPAEELAGTDNWDVVKGPEVVVFVVEAEEED